jgi:Copper transport outer membrane protein, MctB
MINFRYHLVSLVAVFLALAVGIVAGSTVIRESLVASLEANVRSAERRLDEVQQRNSDLEARLEEQAELQSQLDAEGPDVFLDGALAGTPVLFFTTDGTDGAPLDDLRRSVVSADGRVAGTVQLRDKLALEDPADVAALREVLGSTATDPDALRAELAERLGRLLTSLAWPGDQGGTTGDESVTPVNLGATQEALLDLLGDLETTGFVRLDGIDEGLALDDVRVLAYSGEGASLDDSLVLYPLLGDLADPDEPAAVAVEATAPDAEAPRGSFVGEARLDNDLRNGLSTVDDGEGFAGWAAAVLALAQLSDGRIGHYGIGEGAQRLLPAPAP